MKANEAHAKIYLKDYSPHDFKVTHIDLSFDLDPEKTIVHSELSLEKQNPNASELFLNGENLKLLKISYEGQALSPADYQVDEKGLRVFNINKPKFKLQIQNEISPKANTALEGLYLSKDILCTQNEPEGFRRITYFIDRPDNMAIYKTKITADEKRYPILLSNGNCIGSGSLPNGKHWTEWEDPFPKPSYLFALVAGNLGVIEDNFTTKTGKNVKLYIYCDPGDEHRCKFAMESLIKSMRWDEVRFDLEYDLNEYRIVSVGAFNAGAMENKALNIFNSALVLADQKTATDGDYLAIESVIGHEYFHNWTGNRVTCRDWFQLTLKEGLTVFRDQEFSSDLNSRPVQRILDVARLREAQFPEDASPMAHPIRPDSYVQINNFYTATVYEKGAEVIRMIHTLVGEPGFQKGMKKYFELYDGKAVTTEDFLNAMKLANPHLDTNSMKNWYNQAGTPVVEFNGKYDEATKTYTLSFKQSCPETQETKIKKAFFIPIKIGFIDKSGKEFKPEVADKSQVYWNESVVVLNDFEGKVQFTDVPSNPILSLNRSFSAPIKMKIETSLEEQLHLFKFDQDHFNKFESSQNIASDWIQVYLDTDRNQISANVIEAYRSVLLDPKVDNHMKALLLSPPAEAVLHQSQNPIDFRKTSQARKTLIKALAEALETELLETYNKYLKIPGAFSSKTVGDRQLRNTSLSFLCHLGDKYFSMVLNHFKNADNMTDQFLGLNCFNVHFPQKAQIYNEDFYNQWRKDDLVMQKWIVAQMQDQSESVYDKLNSITKLPEYKDTVPNYVRALWGGFSRNFVMFHNENGKGYELMSKQIVHMDKVNRSVAAALTKTFRIKPSVRDKNKALIDAQLQNILDTQGISSNVAEVADQILKS